MRVGIIEKIYPSTNNINKMNNRLSTVMVNNSTNITRTKNLIIEHQKKIME